ncbi:hypothetical protein C8R42DRAFT_723065 [Lentinula raphanica]|nr:hypothetical protein C8R42DRAFT_723065 [Lentinula raphanica]
MSPPQSSISARLRLNPRAAVKTTQKLNLTSSLYSEDTGLLTSQLTETQWAVNMGLEISQESSKDDASNIVHSEVGDATLIGSSSLVHDAHSTTTPCTTPPHRILNGEQTVSPYDTPTPVRRIIAGLPPYPLKEDRPVSPSPLDAAYAYSPYITPTPLRRIIAGLPPYPRAPTPSSPSEIQALKSRIYQLEQEAHSAESCGSVSDTQLREIQSLKAHIAGLEHDVLEADRRYQQLLLTYNIQSEYVDLLVAVVNEHGLEIPEVPEPQTQKYYI